MPQKPIATMLALLFLAAAPCLASQTIGSQNAELVEDAEVGFLEYYLGEVFGYETDFGRVEVKARGFGASFGVRLANCSELSYDYLEFDIDSYFTGSQVGDNDIEAHAISLKTIYPRPDTFNARDWKLGLEYKLLTGSPGDDIHFASLFSTVKLGVPSLTGGISTYFGDDVDTEFGGFVNLSFSLGDEGELFLDYNSLDFMRAFINHYIPAGAANIGTFSVANAPKDALTAGLRLKRDYLTLLLYLHSIDQGARPAVGASVDY